MKTLWEKLSEENKLRVNAYQEAYNINNLEVLKTEVAWTNLRVIEMMHLFDALEVKEFEFITPLDNIFYGK